MARYFVTGGCGFVGSNLVDRLIAQGAEVTIYDNLRTGRRQWVEGALATGRARLVEGDILDAERLKAAVGGHDLVFHLAANADVRRGLEHPRRDIEQNLLGTHNVLEAMRETGVKRIAFTSTGSVYGEAKVFPTPEDCPFPIQTSLYATSKIAAEGLVSAYCEGFGFTGWIFRFVSVLGERYSHGHVIDFTRRLGQDPTQIHVLGDGQQRKSYMDISDCLDGVLTAVQHPTEGVAIYNVGTDETLTVDESLDEIVRALGVNPRRTYEGGARGWVGDAPVILLDCSRLRALGWRPHMPLREAVARTVRFLLEMMNAE
jgi:UDP-glucose 4-epimerase